MEAVLAVVILIAVIAAFVAGIFAMRFEVLEGKVRRLERAEEKNEIMRDKTKAKKATTGGED